MQRDLYKLYIHVGFFNNITMTYMAPIIAQRSTIGLALQIALYTFTIFFLLIIEVFFSVSTMI